MDLCDLFSVVNFIVGCCLLNSVKVFSLCLFFFGRRLKGCHQHI
jgi:hypothetical protein